MMESIDEDGSSTDRTAGSSHTEESPSSRKRPWRSCLKTSSNAKLSDESSTLSVSFGSLHIREYTVVCGDNPACLTGAPLALGWDVLSEHSLEVVAYEDARPPRRTGRSMIVPKPQREKWLLQAGYSRKELTALTKPVNIARHQRKTTVATMGLSTIETVKESLWRKTRNVLSGGAHKRAEREYLAAALAPPPLRQTQSDKVQSSSTKVVVSEPLSEPLTPQTEDTPVVVSELGDLALPLEAKW